MAGRSIQRLSRLTGEPPEMVRRVLTVMVIASAMVSLFAVSYSLALGRPTPHDVPAAVVGDATAPRSAQLLSALERASAGGLSFRRLSSAAAARRAIDSQRVYAAVVLSSHPPALLLSSAAGTSVARLLVESAARLAEEGYVLHVVDLHPLPRDDPQGLVAFYVSIAATILGFVTMFQLRAHAAGLSLRSWILAIGALAVGGGLLLAIVTDPVIGALRGAFFELWLALAAEVAVAALFAAAMMTLFGRWAMVPTWGLFVALGNASSGGAVAPPLLPAFYEFLGRFVPNGATVQTIRNLIYFRAHQPFEPKLVELIWFTAALGTLVVASRRLHRTPGTP